MFVEVEVEAGPNCNWSLVKMFEALEEPRQVGQVMAALPDGSTGMCMVTGWSQEGPCPAYAVKVSDSGEGVALLVYGGDGGIRIQAADSPEAWNVTSPHQWGEPCLLLSHDTPTE